MIPQTQSRVGPHGRCFPACLASILELPEAAVPGYEDGVYGWLARRGLRYETVPVDAPAPVGWHIIEGLSPRGGQHAIVGLNGQPAWDPHPQDGTGRGLKVPERWGLLLPIKGAVDAEPVPPYAPGDKIQLPGTRKQALVRKCVLGKNLFGEPEWHVSTTSGEVVTVRVKAEDSLGPMMGPGDYSPAKARAEASRHRKVASELGELRGSLRPEFTKARRAHWNAAGVWDDVAASLALWSDEGEEKAEELWPAVARLSAEADNLSAPLLKAGVKATDNLPAPVPCALDEYCPDCGLDAEHCQCRDKHLKLSGRTVCGGLPGAYNRDRLHRALGKAMDAAQFVENRQLTDLAEKVQRMWLAAPNTYESLAAAAKVKMREAISAAGTTPEKLADYVTKMATANRRRVNVNHLRNLNR